MTEWSQQRRSLEQRPGTTPTTPTHSSPPRRIFKYEFVASLPLSPSVKEFGKSVDIWGSYAQEFSVLFTDSGCIHIQKALDLGSIQVWFVSRCVCFTGKKQFQTIGSLRLSVRPKS